MWLPTGVLDLNVVAAWWVMAGDVRAHLFVVVYDSDPLVPVHLAFYDECGLVLHPVRVNHVQALLGEAGACPLGAGSGHCEAHIDYQG